MPGLQPFIPIAMGLDFGIRFGIDYTSAKSRGLTTGESLLYAGVNGGIGLATQSIGIPGIIPNSLLHAGMNVTGNGISNTILGEPFFENWGPSAISGGISGGLSGYSISKDQGLNYLWGNEVKYGRTQWSFFTSEKPYETIEWNIRNVGSNKVNDCVATTFAEADDYFGGTISYEDYLSSTNYEEGIGTLTNKAGYQKMLSEKFKYVPFDPTYLADPQNAQEMLSRGYLLNTNMPYGGIRHADNLRAISYYHSGKITFKYRIGSFRLRSIDDNWWFYLLRELR